MQLSIFIRILVVARSAWYIYIYDEVVVVTSEGALVVMMYSYWTSHFLNLSMCANIYSIFIDFHFYWQWHQHIIVIGWYWLIPIDPDVDISMMWPCSQKHQRVTHVPWTSILMTFEKLWLLKIYADINVVPQCRQTAITKQFNKATVLNRGPSSWWETSIIIMVAFMLGNYIQVIMDVWILWDAEDCQKIMAGLEQTSGGWHLKSCWNKGHFSLNANVEISKVCYSPTISQISYNWQRWSLIGVAEGSSPKEWAPIKHY